MDLMKLPSWENKDRGYVGWIPGLDAMNSKDGWSTTMEYADWNDFLSTFGDNDKEYNTVINFYFSGSKNEYHLNLWILHPRKGASRGAVINVVTEADLPSIHAYLQEHLKVVDNWFDWVRKPFGEKTIPVEDAKLSLRSFNCLKRAGFNTLNEVAEKTDEELHKIRNLGRACFEEIQSKLIEYGMKNGATEHEIK